MEYFYYYIYFPDGEKQEIFHPLSVGDIVDINGNIYSIKNLDPHKIAYKVNGFKKQSHFKETAIFYKLDLLNRDEVADEIDYTMIHKNVDLNKVFEDLERKLRKKKKR
jgi:hypothetical protein